MKKISKIVITGGPCGGKTTAMSWIQNAFTARGYRVLFVPETATEFIKGGVAPWTCGTNLDYQKCQMALQLEKERLFLQAALSMNDERILIVCDRGALDNRAYMNDEEFAAVLASVNRTETSLRDSYDGIFHLVTAAKGAVEFYTTANNQARIETPEQAVALDDKLIAAWTGHPHLRIIDNNTDFEQKMRRLLQEIATCVGGPESFAIDRKYLIRFPDIQWLESQPNCRRVEIIQTYLKSDDGMETRIRQRGMDGQYTCYETKKKKINSLKRVETERRLSPTEFMTLMMKADTSRRQIRKTRYCLTWGTRSYEIDVFPFWKKQALLVAALGSEDEEVIFPPGIEVIREVTEDDRYRNGSMAVKIPEEG